MDGFNPSSVPKTQPSFAIVVDDDFALFLGLICDTRPLPDRPTKALTQALTATGPKQQPTFLF